MNFKDRLYHLSESIRKTSAIYPALLALLLLPYMFSCKKENSPQIPAITITSVPEITATSVTSAVAITNEGGESVTNKGICWSINQNPTIADNKTINDEGSGSFVSSITGLNPGTTYYIRAFATNLVGTGYSSQTTVKTLALAPLLTTAPVSDISDNKATSGGNITNDGGAPVTARGVCWSASQNPTIADSKTSDGTGIGSFTSSLTGLSANSTYYLRAYATNSSGTSYGNQVLITTTVFSDGSYVTLKKATVGRGIDLVFFGDGYTIQDISSDKYKNNINQAVAYFFAVEPYKSYSAYFNIYMVYAVSAESGISNTTTTVNTKFETKFAKVGTSEMTTNFTTCRTYTLKAPIINIDNTLAVLIANSTQYGGTTYMHGGTKGLNVSICPINAFYFRGIVQHEAGGHGFGNLADEYVNNFSPIPQSEIDILRAQQNYGIFLNVDLTDNLSNILWKHFISLPKYTYVGAFEGANLYSQGVWRSESNSLMINNINYINAPSRELIVKRIMKLAGLTYSFSEFQTKDVMELTATKSAAFIDKSLQLPPPVIVK